MARRRRDAPVERGDVLDGKYRVEKILGSGGMGTVVAAQHVKLNTRVALKFLHPSLAKDTEAVQRFEREARAAVALKSEHAVRILDVGELKDGSPYLVMEFLVGSDLAAVVDHGDLAVHEAVGYILQACEAIAEAHSIGIVHRDIKPQNLFLTEGPRGAPLVKVVDFGLAKMLKPSSRQSSITQTADVMGSPSYMSPEQVRAAKEVDARSDVWSLGVCLYEMLMRYMPFEGGTLAALSLAVVRDPPRPMMRDDLPEALAAAVMRCLEKDPGARFPDVVSFAAAIEPFADESIRGAVSRMRLVVSRGESRGMAGSSDPPPPLSSFPPPPQDESPQSDRETRTVAVVDSDRRREAKRRRTFVGVAVGAIAAVTLGALAFVEQSGGPSTASPAASLSISDTVPTAPAVAPSASAPLPVETLTPLSASALPPPPPPHSATTPPRYRPAPPATPPPKKPATVDTSRAYP
jgi:eukaryotic-like serine/threonine-protein kinase